MLDEVEEQTGYIDKYPRMRSCSELTESSTEGEEDKEETEAEPAM